jgi:hypothetical protein
MERLSLHYPLGPIIVLASLYFIYDGYKTTSGAQMLFAAVALLWSLFTVFTFVVN